MLKGQETLDNITLFDLIKGIILLKPCKQVFSEEELRTGIRKATEIYPRLEIVSHRNYETLENLFFFDSDVLNWELNLPNYQLSKAGRIRYKTHLKKEYGPNVLEYIKPLADEVWACSTLNQSTH